MHVRLSSPRSPIRASTISRGLRIHPALDELAHAQVDMQRELFVHFLMQWNPPQPRSQGTLHTL
jgi:hypothetical protein